MTDYSGWIAPNETSFAAVDDPIKVDELARDLREYHPTSVENGLCQFQLKLNESADQPYAYPFVPNDEYRENWHEEFLALLSLLQFNLYYHPEIGEILIDRGIGSRPQSGMGTGNRWKAVEWSIVKAEIDPQTKKVIKFREGIFWETVDGKQAFSTYGWKPY